MPPLSKRLSNVSPQGYVAQDEQPAPSPVLTDPGKVLGANPYIRCPLPPFNSSPDSLRQFNENGKIPARRVIPLPIATAAGGNTTITNNTEVISSSGSSSSGSSTTTLTVKTVTLTCPTLLPGGSTTAALTVSHLAVLMILGSSDLCEVRIYGDPLSQAADLARATDNAPAFEITQGLVTDIVLDTLPLQWNWQNRLFVNQDNPTKTNLYITVINPTSSAVTPSVTITYLPLE